MSFPAIGIDSGVLGFHPFWCPSPFPSLSILGVFHLPLSAIGFQSFFFFRIATHSVHPSLTEFLGEFAGLGLALLPDVVVPEAEQRCVLGLKAQSKFLPWPGYRTSELGI